MGLRPTAVEDRCHARRMGYVTSTLLLLMLAVFLATSPGCTKKSTNPIKTGHPPVLDSIGAQTVVEGAQLAIRIHAFDPDSTLPKFKAVGVPLNAVFKDSGDGAGSFVFSPDSTEVGTQSVIFIASDSLLADSELVVITVTARPRNLLVNGSFEEFGLPSLEGWIVSDTSLVGIDSDPDPNGGAYSLGINDNRGLGPPGLAWAPIPQAHHQDVIEISAHFKNGFRAGTGIIGIFVGQNSKRKVLSKQVTAPDSKQFWISMTMVDTLYVAPTDSAWVFLQGGQCYDCFTASRVHYDLVTIQRLRSLGP